MRGKFDKVLGWISTSSSSNPFVYIPLNNYVHGSNRYNRSEENYEDEHGKRATVADEVQSVCTSVWKISIVFGFILLLITLIIYAMDENGYYEVDDYYHGAEEEFARIPNATMAREWLRFYTSKPHIAGSKEDLEQAKWTMAKFEEFGIPQVKLQTFYPLLNRPLTNGRRVRLIEPLDKAFECTLHEDPISEDDTSVQFENAVPPFHGYSANGNVTGQLVYVNYGRREDFELLRSKGVDFKGKIALVRYGRNFRGLKVRAAEIFGCSGVIVYSDPADDGSNKGATYPDGPWRPETSVQRGSVHYMSLYPGDPLTPGYPAHKGSRRLSKQKATSLPKIPSIPISYADAKPLLESLMMSGFASGEDLPFDWKGGLPFDKYWSGPGTAVVNLQNENKFEIAPIWNVIGEIPGSDEPEKRVIIGNHRDAWVMGAVDPNSGSSCLMEVARGLGQLLRNGWRPRRTIVLTSWDGEEYGMLGSTEYVEELKQELMDSAVAYLNVDSGASGQWFQVSATPSLSQMIRNISHLIADPQTGQPLSTGLEIGTLGSGSDFVGFVDFCGVAAASFAFKGDYGVYHSIYDSFHWMEKFGDPNNRYQETMAVLWGIAALRLADSLILPFNYTEYSFQLSSYVESIRQKFLSDYPELQFPLLNQQIETLHQVAAQISSQIKTVSSEDFETIDSINWRLIRSEREFLDPKGIPSRPWFKHVVFAPGLWAGYGAATFPTLTEALESKLDMETIQRIESELAYRVKRVATVLSGQSIADIEQETDLLSYNLFA